LLYAAECQKPNTLISSLKINKDKKRVFTEFTILQYLESEQEAK